MSNNMTSDMGEQLANGDASSANRQHSEMPQFNNSKGCSHRHPKRNARRKTITITTEDFAKQEETTTDVRLQTCIVVLHTFIKREMEITLAKSIADNLLSNSKLTRQEYEEINSCKERRRTNDLLLQTVMLGDRFLHDAFKKALCIEEPRITNRRTITMRLNNEDVSERDMKAFRQINYGKAITFKSISKHLRDKCIELIKNTHLDDKAVANLLDNLLTRFVISISEYVDILRTPLGMEEMIEKLINVLNHRPAEVYTCLLSSFDIASTDNQKPETVKMERFGNDNKRSKAKRKQPEIETAPTAKRRIIDASTEYKIIMKAQSTTDVREQTEKEISFCIESFDKGSIKMTLIPKDENSWNKLQQKCKNDNIINYIPVVYNQDAESLEEGEYIIDFTIWKKSGGELPVAEFHFVSTDDDTCESHTTRGFFEENRELLTEELEITDALLSWLTEKNILDVNEAAKIQEVEFREKRNLLLLKQVNEHGEIGYKTLKDYIERTNKWLFENMIRNEGLLSFEKNFDDATSVSSRTRSKTNLSNELFYTASVIMKVTPKDARKTKRTKTSTVLKIKTVLSRKCFFNEGEDSEQSTPPDLDTIDTLFKLERRTQEREGAEKQVSKSKKKKRE